MNVKGTLELYDELVSKGIPEAAARAQATQLGELGTGFQQALVTLNERLAEIDKDLFWMRIIGGAMTLAFMTNGIGRWFA